jgi:hypothetical protein
MQDYPCQFNIQPIDGNCSQTQEGEYRYETYSVQVADKHDGVVNIHSALWNSNDSFDDLNNLYMSDVELNGNGMDEGATTILNSAINTGAILLNALMGVLFLSQPIKTHPWKRPSYG